MKLTIHRGSHEIGGSCLEIATAATRIVLDVGLPLEKPGTDPDAENELARNRIAAIFAKFPPVSALFLSHAHQDHPACWTSYRIRSPFIAARARA